MCPWKSKRSWCWNINKKYIDVDNVHKSDVDAAEGKSGNRENSKTDAERKNHNDSDNHKNQ